MKRAYAVLAACAAALAAAIVAAPKEEARARLTAPLPVHAAPGATIRVRWSVDVPDGRGRREPFNAIGMFVRLLSRTGAPATIGLATATAHEDGRYAAAVRFPRRRDRRCLVRATRNHRRLFPARERPVRVPGRRPLRRRGRAFGARRVRRRLQPGRSPRARSAVRARAVPLVCVQRPRRSPAAGLARPRDADALLPAAPPPQ